MRRSQWLPVLLVAVPLSFPAWLTPAPAVLRHVGMTDLLQMLGSIFMVALVLERALEVFVTSWRGPVAAALDHEVQKKARGLAKLEILSTPQRRAHRAERETALAALERVEEQRRENKCVTQRLALLAGLTLGLLVSAVGIRTLSPLVDPDFLATIPAFQRGAFQALDVLLTGGLIAGGSEGIHKLTQVYSRFMETSAKRAMGEAS